jgi:phage terminase large subunit-like protein
LPAATARNPRKMVGHPTPRIGPPTPARSDVKRYEETASSIGIDLMPWQVTVGRYLYATGAKQSWQFPEVAALVARQNGKTALLLPHIVTRLEMGRRMLHAAQTRELPRLTFNRLAPIIEARHPDAKVRRGAGQETIELSNGALYRITAATSGGPRGMSVDDLIVDELREIDEDFAQAAIPTMAASSNPQVLYLSNAGEEMSTVLNAVRQRAEDDPSLAWLEWSAAPERAADDVNGWLESTPAIGHLPGILPTLERLYRSHKLAGTMSAFETEHLTRWVTTMREQLVDAYAWSRCRGQIGEPVRPSIAVSMAPDGHRASVAMAWRYGDGVALKILLNVTGDPVDTDAIGLDVKRLAAKYKVRAIGFDPLTDAELVKYVKKAEPIAGQKYANASAQFVNIVGAERLRWQDADAVTDDLTWTSRKPDGDFGSYHAVRAADDRSITAALAAVRAVWLASGPVPAIPRVL